MTAYNHTLDLDLREVRYVLEAQYGPQARLPEFVHGWIVHCRMYKCGAPFIAGSNPYPAGTNPYSEDSDRDRYWAFRFGFNNAIHNAQKVERRMDSFIEAEVRERARKKRSAALVPSLRGKNRSSA
jgi:hypothetical protein